MQRFVPHDRPDPPARGNSPRYWWSFSSTTTQLCCSASCATSFVARHAARATRQVLTSSLAWPFARLPITVVSVVERVVSGRPGQVPDLGTATSRSPPTWSSGVESDAEAVTDLGAEARPPCANACGLNTCGRGLGRPGRNPPSPLQDDLLELAVGVGDPGDGDRRCKRHQLGERRCRGGHRENQHAGVSKHSSVLSSQSAVRRSVAVGRCWRTLWSSSSVTTVQRKVATLVVVGRASAATTCAGPPAAPPESSGSYCASGGGRPAD